MIYVYMARNASGNLYVGISNDPEKRVRTHNKKAGANFTKHDPTFKIVFLEKHGAIGDARKREIQIKKWKRDKKELLIVCWQKSLPTKLV